MRPIVMLLVLVLLFFSAISVFASIDIVLIVNKDVPGETITQRDLKKIFLGRTVKWPDNTDIRIAIMKEELHEPFLKVYVKRSIGQFQNTWKKIMFMTEGISTGNDLKMS